MERRALVTGANGFIGRHLVERLLAEGWTVMIYDRKLEPDWIKGACRYWRGDIFIESSLHAAMGVANPSVVFHLAALADVRNALNQPREQMMLNFQATAEVLEAMRAVGVNRLAFTSSAVVYGDSTGQLTERGTCYPQQTSIYGAMKLASESLIAAYCQGYGMRADIFRLVSLVGAGYRHGNLMDFYRRLKVNPERLEILGTGQQQKFYIDVHDVIDAMLLAVSSEHDGAALWNVSHHEPNTINDSITAVSEVLGVTPTITHGPDPWAGDLPGLVLDCAKLRSLGWAPTVPIAEGMRATVRDFVERGL